MLTMVLALVLSILPMGAMAMTDADVADIVVSGLAGTDADAATGVAVDAYRVMDVIYDDTADQPAQPVYVWETAVAAWVTANYSSYIGENNAVTEAFYGLASDTVGYGSDIATFYDQMAAAIKGGTITLSPAGSGVGNCSLEDLEMGNYLVLIENGMKIYRPSTLNLIPTWDANGEAWTLADGEVVIKASEPSVTKTLEVNDAAVQEAQVGDTVTYTVTAAIPVYPDNATAKGYQIGDDLPDGVTLDAASVAVVGVKAGESDVDLEAGGDKDYTLTTASGTKTGNDTAVDLLLTFDYEQIRAFDSVVITYEAAVNQNVALGTDGNENAAYLAYNNNPYDADSWKEKEANTTFYSFGIQVTKTDETGNTLAGAEFSLSDGAGELTFLKDETNNRYYLSSAAGSSSVLAVDENGLLKIHGLVAGEYTLTETKAPGGYVKLQNPITVTVTESTETPGAVAVESEDQSGTTTVTAKEDGVVELTVANVEGFTLPITGGEGIMLFSLIGIVMMGGGLLVILAVLRRWKRAY